MDGVTQFQLKSLYSVFFQKDCLGMHNIAVCDTIQVISLNECPFNEILPIGDIHTDTSISALFINDCS